MSRVLLIGHGYDAPFPDRVRLFLQAQGRAYDEIAPCNGDALPESLDDIAAVVIYGGAQEIYQTDLYPYLADEHAFTRRLVAADIPVLGLCLGAQCIAYAHGAEVTTRSDSAYEFGYYDVTPTEAGRDFLPDGPARMPQWHWHYAALPEGAELLAHSELFPTQAFRLGSAYGFQFHPEVTPEIMRFWQDLDGAPYGRPGSQTRAEQDRHLAEQDARIDRWFNAFLTEFFA